ncbi:MAG: hypothetical protein CVU91_00310 [Firmicutes bacterium HGW-Firmicutes-16]|nr:MAG: hypothetical protein CVU91_00310 [Firmicutes bacterium HGW-Firmicutes-16]
MKTNKKFLSLALALILILALAACGAASKSADGSSTSNVAAVPAPEEAGEFDMAESQKSALTDTSGTSTGENVTELPTADKIIYTGYASLETLDFDKTMTDLQQLIKDCGGFVQSSNVTGGDYSSIYGGTAVSRTADYSIRVPVDKFKSVTDSLKNLGNVVSSSTNADNITPQYTDTQSRLDAYKTEETRLLELLAKASSVEDMLAIETRLSDVRYNVESLTSQLKNWDSQVSYSTLTLSVREVTLYSKDNSATVSYGEQIKQTFTHSLYSLGNFFKGLLKFIVAIFPALVVLGVIAIIVLLIVRAATKKKRAKPLAPPVQNQDSGNDRPPYNQ